MRERVKKFNFDEISNLRSQSKTWREISEITGLSFSYLANRWLSEARKKGVVTDLPEKKSRYNHEVVKKLKNSGLTHKEISDVLNIPLGTITGTFSKEEKKLRESEKKEQPIQLIFTTEQKPEPIKEVEQDLRSGVENDPHGDCKSIIKQLQEENQMLRKLLKAAL